MRWFALLVLSLSPCLGRAAAPPADPSLITRWPATARDREHTFEGGAFVALTPAPVVGNGPYSIAVWVNPTDLAGGNPAYGRGIARSTRGEQVGDWLLSVHPDGRVRFCNWRKPGDDPQGSHVTRKPLVLTDTWSHLVAVWDGKTNRLFVNGVEAPSDNGATAAGWGVGHEVGRCWTEASYAWDGFIDGLRIGRKALTAAEVRQGFETPPKVQSISAFKSAADPKVSQAIDRIIRDTIQNHNVVAAPPADDAEFHRRVMLDLISRVPTLAETEAFLADKSSDKRPRLIDSLLAGREMPSAWAQVLSGWLMPKEGRRDPQMLGYLRNGLAKNRSWDQFAREMLRVGPESLADQSAGGFLNYRKAALKDNTLARDVGRAFFGVNLRCAQCHDHPHIKEWTLERFYGLSAFFVRSYDQTVTDAQKQQRVVFAEKAVGELEYVADGKKKIAPLMFLDGNAIKEPARVSPAAPPFSRREALARVALSPKSPFFKRAMVNRVWQRLMGRGLVEPVDMMHEGNIATHPPLIDLLADDFANHGFDLRRLITVIMQSETYARSSRWAGQGVLPNETLYAVAGLRPLDADQMTLSLPVATGYYEGKSSRTLAQLKSVVTWKEVLTEFEADSEEFEPTSSQALFLTNSNYVQTHFLVNSNLVQALTGVPDDAALARRVYLSVLSRLPSASETALVGRYLRERGSKSRAEACRELVWALLSGSEFRFNH